MIEILKIEEAHLTHLVNLMHECFNFLRRESVGLWKWMRENEFAQFYGVMEDGVLVAYMMFYQEDAEEVFLAELGVTAKARRRGLGRSLLLGIKDRAAPTTKRIHVMTRKDYEVAQVFYEALGFTRGKFVRAYDPWFPDVIGVEYRMDI